jgi:hypothetical protein
MDRYIVTSYHACAVFYDEIAASPLDAIRAGDEKISSDSMVYDWCQSGDPNSIWVVYRASPGFQEVDARDYGLVTDQCEYVGSFKKSLVDEAA